MDTDASRAHRRDDEDLDRRLGALDLHARTRVLTGADNWHTHGAPAAGLAPMHLSDGPAGVRGSSWDAGDPSANLPCPTAIAASFDAEHVRRLGALLAGEARRKGAHVLLGPTINLQRTPVGGRHFECFSEDPLLTAQLAVAYVEGVQGGGVAATPKHLVANDSETARHTVDVRVSGRALHEVYLAPFEAAVREAGAWAVMAAYNSLGGITMTEHPLLMEVLRDRWGFDGLVVSDWYAATTLEDTARGGLDLVMPGPGGPWRDGLAPAVEDGRVPAAAVDDKVRRLLRLARRVGALGEPAAVDTDVHPPGPGQPPGPQADGDPVRRVLREAARRGFVLLRNDGLLPLPEDLSRVAVIGPNAEHGRSQGGGSASVSSPHVSAPLAALRERLGDGVEVDHAVGARIRRTIRPLGASLSRDPETGDGGLRVRFLDDDGAVLGEQHRRSSSMTWFESGFEVEGLDDDEVRAIEVHALLGVPGSGTWRVGVAGVGRYAVDLDGRRIIDAELPVPEGDLIEVLVRPHEATADVDLEAGAEVELVCRHEVTGTGAILRLGAQPVTDPEEELAEAAGLAAAADVAVVIVGTNAEVESEGFDRDTLALPGRQDELVRRVVAANPRTVVVVNAGAPVLLPWVEDVAATLVTWFPGQEFGDALAEVLVGDAEPSGRLPMTWPASDGTPQVLDPTPVDGRLEYAEGIHVGHRRFLRDGLTPAFWFGHGLGYTTWSHERVSVAHPDALGEGAEVRVLVRNTGRRTGREVVQVYLARPHSAAERPVRWLAGAASVLVPPGATSEVAVEIPARALMHVDDGSDRWAIEAGDFDVAVGRSVADIRLRTVLVVPGA
jgi:beta-glucosidase